MANPRGPEGAHDVPPDDDAPKPRAREAEGRREGQEKVEEVNPNPVGTGAQDLGGAPPPPPAVTEEEAKKIQDESKARKQREFEEEQERREKQEEQAAKDAADAEEQRQRELGRR
jgi:hypothetical protein